MDGLLSRLDRAQKKISDSEITYEKNAQNIAWKYGKTWNAWVIEMCEKSITFLKEFSRQHRENEGDFRFKDSTNENFTELKIGFRKYKGIQNKFQKKEIHSYILQNETTNIKDKEEIIKADKEKS